MIKKNLKILILTSIIILLPMVAGLVLWNQLPGEIPYHWNAAGEVDGWASKPMAVFGTSALMLGLQWLAVIATLSDPKKQNHSQKVLQLIFWFIPVLTVVLSAMIYATAFGGNVRVEMIVPVLLGVVFVAVGNYLPKCKQNYTVGIKIPWTLHSEENWNRTHRLAGYVWVAGGVVMALSGFIGIFWLSLPAALCMALIPVIYSFVLSRKGI